MARRRDIRSTRSSAVGADLPRADVLALVVAFATSPGSAPTVLFVIAFLLAPMLALGIGLVDYAAQHGVKESMRKDRDKQRRATAKSEEQTNVP